MAATKMFFRSGFDMQDIQIWKTSGTTYMSTGDQTRSRSRRASPRGRSGTGSHSQGSSSHSRGSSSHCRDSSFHAPIFAPDAAPPPVAAPPPAPPVVSGVMIVAQLVQQPGCEHLPYLTPCPKGRRQTWFNRSENEISAWINNMMYSNLSKGYPTFSNFPAEDQKMWFRQFAVFNQMVLIFHSFKGFSDLDLICRFFRSGRLLGRLTSQPLVTKQKNRGHFYEYSPSKSSESSEMLEVVRATSKFFGSGFDMHDFQIWKTSGTTYIRLPFQSSGLPASRLDFLEVVWTSLKSSDEVLLS
ncbi:hypothetical protein F2Q70_00005958 [Brassica cretica]|uniref:Uncharacterized protein n=1 Tax=Brassica cretica TaxID=69181 RepID=A0A8S9J2U6_BRACR|nr:hypothetical protein F2Q70_00005958 [Brassica cretica]